MTHQGTPITNRKALPSHGHRDKDVHDGARVRQEAGDGPRVRKDLATTQEELHAQAGQGRIP
jgi:hypothetical protein